MRGWGAPSNESVTSSLTNPDWGWGDYQSALITPTSDTKDYGWGSPRESAFPSFLILDTTTVGDDGGYRVIVRGDFPRDGLSIAQRIGGFTVTLIDTTTGSESAPVYSSRIGRGTDAATNYKGNALEFSTPLLDTAKTYTVRLTKNNQIQDVGDLTVRRRMRTHEEYEMRSACPEHWDAGPRTPAGERLLDASGPIATSEQHSNLSILIRSIAQSLAEFKARGVTTRTIYPFAVGVANLLVESTLGMADSGSVWVGRYEIKYTNKGTNSLQVAEVIPPLSDTIDSGALVSHDPHI